MEETMDNQSKWSGLLAAAVSEPGLILKAYSNFHGYSLGNQLAALMQCHLRGLPPGPINTYPGWRSLGRQVKRGEKAIWLCIPLVRSKKSEQQGKDEYISGFLWRP